MQACRRQPVQPHPPVDPIGRPHRSTPPVDPTSRPHPSATLQTWPGLTQHRAPIRASPASSRWLFPGDAYRGMFAPLVASSVVPWRRRIASTADHQT